MKKVKRAKAQARLLHCPICHKGYWSSGNYQKYCSDCTESPRKKQRREWYENNRDKRIKDSRVWALANPEKVHRYSRRWEKRNKILSRAGSRRMYYRKRYGSKKMGDMLFLINNMKNPKYEECVRDGKTYAYLRRVCNEIETL